TSIAHERPSHRATAASGDTGVRGTPARPGHVPPRRAGGDRAAEDVRSGNAFCDPGAGVFRVLRVFRRTRPGGGRTRHWVNARLARVARLDGDDARTRVDIAPRRR